MSTNPSNQKRVVINMGGKGGGGKTSLMASLADYLHSENCPVTLIDCDIEKKLHGSLSHFFKDAAKVDITQADGFDESVDKVLCDEASMVLADLGVRKREAFLRSRLRMKQFGENDEVLAVAVHLDNFAALINDMIIAPENKINNALAGIKKTVETLAKEIRDILDAYRSLPEIKRRRQSDWLKVGLTLTGAAAVFLSGWLTPPRARLTHALTP